MTDSPAPSSPDDAGPVPRPPDEQAWRQSGEIAFARLLGALGLAIIAMAVLLAALPVILGRSASVRLIAYVIAILFGPIGMSLLGAAWRIRNRAVHGTENPPSHRRLQRAVGMAMIGLGLLVASAGIGASGALSSALYLIWGVSLAVIGLRSLVRSFSAAGG